jgi:hypothetical protein
MSKKYYFDIPYKRKYETIWYGYLEFDKKIELFINDISLLNEVITEITNISFYINIEDNKMYLSVDNDGNYYDSSRFENDIRNIITHIEKHLSKNDFKISFSNGEFTAIEYKPDGNQYKYKLTNNLDEKKIDIKKRVLNWTIIKPKS